MAEFDTSGKAYKSISETSMEAVYWSELDAFTQGYVTAILHGFGGADPGAFTFADLAPDALALIVADCAAFQAVRPNQACMAGDGTRFWEWRQTRAWIREGFPPLCARLGDEGRIYLDKES